ncbi:hypothetical protein F3Y22_tig00000002pilonHSYRG00153 [Hibiscus syriacus]|uniref:Uncharacterized protein n=1 Tax=Hibiscus syriacus TaxID=106335 RepID=A0A6A3D3L3_HIBSY|nr:hypothetical protein F3Y22_tig00000002pilonHSYRG00153 [Hibiscus syriacus]
MTMVPAEKLSKQHHLPHDGGFYGFDCGRSYTESLGLMRSVHGHDYQNEAYLVVSDLVVANSMAEDESRTNSDNNNQEQEERDKGWLQLSIGGQTQATRTYDEYYHNKNGRGGSTLTELGLLPGGGSQSPEARPLAPFFRMPEFRPPPRPTVINSFSTLFLQQHQQGSSSMIPHHGEINRAFKPIAPSSSSSSLAPYFVRPFQVQSMDVAGPSSEVRIIDPPRRLHSGIWFMLQASHNQAKEPFLPQIPKSYLRMKDGKMTVRLIMKYLANKLRLDSESENLVGVRDMTETLELTLPVFHLYMSDNIM